MSKNITNTPPSWCPDAVPSDRGWRHPKTGELLVSVRGGVLPTKKSAGDNTLLTEVPKTKDVISEVEESKVIDENTKEETVIPDEQPQEVITETKTPRKRRGRNA